MFGFERKREVLHRRVSRHGFFSGESGHQILAESVYLFGRRLWFKELDGETVPHWHYVQQATLGWSSWQSRIVREFEESEAHQQTKQAA